MILTPAEPRILEGDYRQPRAQPGTPALTTAAVPDVVYLLEQVTLASGACYAATGLANVFFSIPIG